MEEQAPNNTQSSGFLEKFAKITDIRPLLERLNNGAIIRLVIGRFIQTYAILAGIGLLIFWVRFFELLGDVSFLQGLGVLIWQIAFPLAAFLSLKAVFLRGNDIINLPDSTFTVAPIVATIVRLHGEVVLIFLLVMSVPAMLIAWLYSSMLYYNFDIPVSGGFWSGPIVFIGCLVYAFLAYLSARIVSELIFAIFSIANNVEAIRNERKQ